jgi:excinuclease UvrABC nuclease subunit
MAKMSKKKKEIKYTYIPTRLSDFIPEYSSNYQIVWHGTEGYMMKNESKVTNEPGVYIVSRKDDSGTLEILYIGSSFKLKNRLSGHDIIKCLRQFYNTNGESNINVCYCLLNIGLHDIRRIEKEMIKKIKPKFNIKDK